MLAGNQLGVANLIQTKIDLLPPMPFAIDLMKQYLYMYLVSAIDSTTSLIKLYNYPGLISFCPTAIISIVTRDCLISPALVQNLAACLCVALVFLVIQKY